MEKIPATQNVAVAEDSKASGDVVHNDHKSGSGRKHAETLSSLAGTVAFAAAAYGSGNYFSVLGSYDPIMASSAAAIALIGTVVVLAANHYGKSR